MIHYFECKLYRLALFIFAFIQLKHDKKYGGRHIDNIKGTTFIPIGKGGYFLEYCLRRNTNNTDNDESVVFQ